ncbi:DUF6414 family protein [Microbacterium saperdae]|uniref:Uncharacterized protein n=1 Tax=Microbacterium saperdae TaxID=69368 RepID=A0A543BIP1_9MICO|nr:hypothetical protein [Microbacterium saperdae]TQL84707.1 hypothetical protein FB560_0298 [Microbacterium saperdae]GGM64788.1 hypothetical protein GCM10010489_40430 [Microbacterium saperdae]
MLKNFLYLNEAALSDYVSALEGGIRSAVGDRRTDSRGAHGKAGFGGFGGGGEAAHESEQTVSMKDTPPAQFERLMRLVSADPEAAGWVEVMDPDSEFPTLGTGSLIDVECDIQIPAFVSMLNRGSGLVDTMKSLSALSDIIPNAANIDVSQLTMLETMTNLLGDRLMIIGSPDSDAWRITGQLLPAHQRVEMEDLEGDVRVVGKVKRRIHAGESHPLMALPGSSVMSREKRREIARKGPSSESDDSWVRGPALVLDILAIYR